MIEVPTQEAPVLLEQRTAKREIREEPLTNFPDFTQALMLFSPDAEGLFSVSMREAARRRQFYIARFLSEFAPIFPMMTGAAEDFVATLGYKEQDQYIAPHVVVHFSEMNGKWDGFPIAFSARGSRNARLDMYRVQQNENKELERLSGISLQRKNTTPERRLVQPEDSIVVSLLSFENGVEEVPTAIEFPNRESFDALHRAVDSIRKNLRPTGVVTLRDVSLEPVERRSSIKS